MPSGAQGIVISRALKTTGLCRILHNQDGLSLVPNPHFTSSVRDKKGPCGFALASVMPVYQTDIRVPVSWIFD
jgi:hypothetical protein